MQAVELDLLERKSLVLGLPRSTHGWIDQDRVVRHAGGGLGGNRAARQALERLAALGLIDRSRIGGRHFYRRTDAGAKQAQEVREWHLDDGLVADAVEDGLLAEWIPAPGDPTRLDDLVGQQAARYRIGMNLSWAARTSRLPAGMLFTGPSGVGKTLFAKIVSKEVSLPLISVSLADLTPPDLEEALEMATDGAVLFLDELQAGRAALRDRMLVALDPSQELPFVAIGATTDPGRLSTALRRRFKVEVAFEDYDLGEAQELTRRRATGMGLSLEEEVPHLIARAGRSNPAKIARLLTEAAMLVEGSGEMLDAPSLAEHLERTGRDLRGLDAVDTQILLALRDEMGDRPAGLAKLAATTELDEGELHVRLAPLRREGLVESRGTAGHAVTRAGRHYLTEVGF